MRGLRFTVLKLDELEPAFDLENILKEVEDPPIKKKASTLAPWTHTYKNFRKIDKNEMLGCKEFILPYKSEGGEIEWKIAGDKELINIGDFELLDPKIEIDLKE